MGVTDTTANTHTTEHPELLHRLLGILNQLLNRQTYVTNATFWGKWQLMVDLLAFTANNASQLQFAHKHTNEFWSHPKSQFNEVTLHQKKKTPNTKSCYFYGKLETGCGVPQ